MVVAECAMANFPAVKRRAAVIEKPMAVCEPMVCSAIVGCGGDASGSAG
jgi:hypothetical protein